MSYTLALSSLYDDPPHYYLVSGRGREGQGEGKKEFGMRAGKGGGGVGYQYHLNSCL